MHGSLVVARGVMMLVGDETQRSKKSVGVTLIYGRKKSMSDDEEAVCGTKRCGSVRDVRCIADHVDSRRESWIRI